MLRISPRLAGFGDGVRLARLAGGGDGLHLVRVDDDLLGKRRKTRGPPPGRRPRWSDASASAEKRRAEVPVRPRAEVFGRSNDPLRVRARARGTPSRDASARFRRLEPLRPKPATARKAARTAPSRSSPRNPGSLRVGGESFQKMRALFGHARRLWSRRPPPDAARSGAISTAECWKNALTVRLHGREVQHPPCPRSTPVKLDRVERPAAFDFHRGKRSRF